MRRVLDSVGATERWCDGGGLRYCNGVGWRRERKEKGE